MSRADTVAVRDGGEALHMDTEKTGERGRLNLADLGKALGHMRNRAVMLAELFTDAPTAAWTRRSRLRTRRLREPEPVWCPVRRCAIRSW